MSGTASGARLPLRTAAGGRALEHAGGAPFFRLAVTAWALVTLAPDDLTRYFADRAARGFTVVHASATASYRPSFDGGRPFLGAGPPWAAVRPDERFWAHVDHLVWRANELGLVMAPLATWGSYVRPADARVRARGMTRMPSQSPQTKSPVCTVTHCVRCRRGGRGSASR